MRILATSLLLAGAAAIAGCATNQPAMADAGITGMCVNRSIDTDSNGMISAAEWNAWRASGFSQWDRNGDSRIDENEFRGCFTAGGFYPANYYDPNSWNRYWVTFDANRDGYLTADEYWSAQSWSTIDRNRNGIIDTNEWNW